MIYYNPLEFPFWNANDPIVCSRCERELYFNWLRIDCHDGSVLLVCKRCLKVMFEQNYSRVSWQKEGF